MGGIGYGNEIYGGGGYGGPTGVLLSLVSALATRENEVQLTFNRAPYFSGAGDFRDAGDPSHYAIAPVAGTTGLDGTPARAITPVSVSVVSPVPAGTFSGAILALTLDRPMTPYSAMYDLTVQGLIDLLGQSLDPGASRTRFAGCFKEVRQPRTDAGHPLRDFANPQTKRGRGSPDTSMLGTFQTGANGDYSLDEGATGYKKRIMRRAITQRDGFMHLPGYGVGIPQEGKRLATIAVREQKAQEWQKQIAQEPDTGSVQVTTRVNPDEPGLVRYEVVAHPIAGTPLQFDHPFSSR